MYCLEIAFKNKDYRCAEKLIEGAAFLNGKIVNLKGYFSNTPKGIQQREAYQQLIHLKHTETHK